ncbi:hypothetical protein PV327_005465 [Microctonus hyperodae]|uniref:Uncharacterized protein n=1 Tax=Microctonus hyperodae TaxID=165561 RepID=A0AA39G1Q8_MICHY|nr:hypothetical protein PV327_005465 [Microctonus hyperodae]
MCRHTYLYGYTIEFNLIMADTENSSSDESLDVTSEKFNPIKALYSSCSIIPVPSAQTYDNITRYEAAIKGVIIKHHNESKDVSNKEKSSKQHILPHQGKSHGKLVETEQHNLILSYSTLTVR